MHILLSIILFKSQISDENKKENNRYLFDNLKDVIFEIIKMNNNKSNYGKSYYMKEIVCIINKILTKRSDSLLRIAQSITVCLFFLQIHFNKHIGKIICFLGPLSFGIYLIHIHPLMNYNF